MAHRIEVPSTSPRDKRGPPPPRRSRRRLWLALGLGLLALASVSRLPPQADATSPASPPRLLAASEATRSDRSWTTLAGAPALFTIEARPTASPTRYEARVQAETGAREDVASLGAFAADPYLRLSLSRSDTTPPASHFVDLARRAADAGLALVRLGRPEALAGRFEGMEVAEASLALAGTTSPRACLSFRVRDASLGFGLAGWLCDDAAPPALRTQLACLVDRVTLAPDIQDLELRAMFAAPPRRPAGCSDETAAPLVEPARVASAVPPTRKRGRPLAARPTRRASQI